MLRLDSIVGILAYTCRPVAYTGPFETANDAKDGLVYVDGNHAGTMAKLKTPHFGRTATTSNCAIGPSHHDRLRVIAGKTLEIHRRVGVHRSLF